jgi:TPR repeat protein
MQGNKFAQFSLGRCYENGIGTGIDMSDAVYWISSAALSGHEIAQLHLGQLYQDGVLVRKDTEQAIKWFGKAADNGDAMAQGLLAKIYEELRISAKSTGSVQWGKYKMDFTLLSDGSAIHQMGMSETVGMIAQSICYELHKYDLYYDMPADEVRNLIRAIQTNNPRVREWDYIREGTEIRIPGYVVQKLVTEPGTD